MDEDTLEQIIDNYQAYVFWASKQILELEDEIEILKNQERDKQCLNTLRY